MAQKHLNHPKGMTSKKHSTRITLLHMLSRMENTNQMSPTVMPSLHISLQTLQLKFVIIILLLNMFLLVILPTTLNAMMLAKNVAVMKTALVIVLMRVDQNQVTQHQDQYHMAPLFNQATVHVELLYLTFCYTL